MNKNKFYLVFNQLKKKEQNELYEYIFANHNKKQIAIKVYKYLLLNQGTMPLQEMTKREMFSNVFGPKETFNYRKLTDAFSDLYLLFEEFILWKHLVQGNLFNRDLILLDVFKKRDLESLHHQKIKQVAKKQEVSSKKDIWYFLNGMKLFHHQYFFSDKAKLINGKEKIGNAMEQLDLFFTAAKICYSCELISRENILQEKFEIKFLEEVIEACKNTNLLDTAYFQVYYQTLELIRHQDQKHYLVAKELFFKHIQIFEPRELLAIFTYLINYTASRIKKGEAHFLKEAFDLYKKGLNEWVFIENNYMPHSRFNNIINIACHLKEYQWAESFINQWQSYLEKKLRKSAVDIGKSRLFFEQGKFNLVIDQLNKVAYSNSYYAIRVKILLIRSHYETNTNHNVLMHMCKAFEVFIRRNQTINVETKKGFLNFIKILLGILGRKQKVKLVKKKLLELSPIVYKEWLLQKIELLENSYSPGGVA